jgi:RNA recognition motif-containing protein
LSRNPYSGSRRQRDLEKAKKRKDKAERKRRAKANKGGGVPVASLEELQPAAVNTSNEEAIAKSDEKPAPRRGPAPRLFVGHLSWDTTTEGLKAFFEKQGEVLDAIVMTDRDTGRSRGFGFVTMADKKAAQAAIDKLDGADLDGRQIRVNVATER